MLDVLTSQVLEQPQTAGAYLDWVKGLIKRVKSEDPDGLRKIMLRIGLAKELMQEAFPIGLFASKYFEGSSQVEIALKVGSQGYDAVVNDQREKSSGITYIEVTFASEGEIDYLRMLTLHETGQVSGLGRVLKTGTKKTGLVVKVENEAVSQAEILAKERSVVSEAIERKLAKAYPAGTALLVAFDDTMSYDRADNIANIEFVLDSYREQLRVFRVVAVVGLVKNLFISRNGTNAT
jgi:hypothetical protein